MYIMRNLMISTAHQIFRLSNQEECDRLGMRHVWRRGEVHIGFWWGVWGKETT
jgi:hypothetical protein